MVTLEEMKEYLRVDFEEEDRLIESLLRVAQSLCMDILRTDEIGVLEDAGSGREAVMYTTAYLYEHREEADHHALMLTLRALLSGSRKEGF